MGKILKAYALAAMLTLGLAAWLAPRAAAQDGKVTGSIVDFDGKPWSGLPVQLKSDQGATQETKTDANGKYQFVSLRSGKYTLIVHPPQIATPFEIPMEVHGAETPPVNLINTIEKVGNQCYPEVGAPIVRCALDA